MRKSFTVGGEYDGVQAGVFLRRACGLSASLIRSVKYLDNGIMLDGAKIRTDHVLRTGDVVDVSLCGCESTVVHAPSVAIDVLYESDAAIVLDKPAGMATHPSLTIKGDTVANAYAAVQGEPCAFRPVFRLDRDTSGTILVAKNRYSAPLLARSSKKSYLAIIEGHLPSGEGIIDEPIGLCTDSIIKRCVTPDGRPSQTRYELVDVCGNYSLVRFTLITGRTHQIRVHASFLGCPLAGDTLYGGGTGLIARQALHCAELSFDDPSAGHVRVVSAPPDDFIAAVALAGLKFSA